MSKPSAPVLLRHQDAYQKLEILAAPDAWIVTLDGRPVTIRSENIAGQYKYLRMAFPAPAHAQRRVQALRRLWPDANFEIQQVSSKKP
jgi:hypothetical protein